MQRRLPLFAVAALLAAPAAHAQLGLATHSAPVNANVTQSFSFANTKILTFDLVRGTSQTINAEDADAGIVEVTGEPNLTVIFTFVQPLSLTKGASAVAFTGDTPRYAATAAGTQSDFAAPAGGNVSLSADGKAFLFLGGTANATATTDTGLHQGNYTITAAYLGL